MNAEYAERFSETSEIFITSTHKHIHTLSKRMVTNCCQESMSNIHRELILKVISLFDLNPS
jgi:hypothetical protein